MIWSKYNFLFKSRKFGNLLYNSLSNTFVKFDDDAYNQVAKLKDNPQESDILQNMGLYMQLSAGGFLIESNDDLISELKTTRRIANFSSKKSIYYNRSNKFMQFQMSILL